MKNENILFAMIIVLALMFVSICILFTHDIEDLRGKVRKQQAEISLLHQSVQSLLEDQRQKENKR